MGKIKVDTVNQYILLDYINNSFNTERLDIELSSRTSVTVSDKDFESLNFYIEDKEIKFKRAD